MLGRLLAGLSLVSLLSTPLAAQTGEFFRPDPTEPKTRVGTRGANFLELGVGARAMGLGGAYSAVGEGLESFYWNSAGLARVEAFAFGYSYSPVYSDLDMSHHFVAGALPLLGGVVGASVNVFTSGDITRTTVNFPDGGDPQFGETFEWTAGSYSLHYAFNVTDRLSFGFAGKVVTEGLSDAKATYYGADAGLLFRTGLLGTTFGASLANLGTNSSIEGRATTRRQSNDDTGGIDDVLLETTEVALPTVFRFAVMWDVTGVPDALVPGSLDHRLSVMTELSDAIDTDTQALVGMEYSYIGRFFLRAGKKWINQGEGSPSSEFADGLGFGGGVRIPMWERNLAIDYAYVDMGVLNNIQVFTFSFGF